MDLRIELEGDKGAFRPGASVKGTFAWDLEHPVQALEMRLFWYTEGKGDRDLEVVGIRRVEEPSLSGWQSFEFLVPKEGPCSYAGRLLSILWALELVAEPGMAAVRQDVVVAQTGRPSPREPSSQLLED